MNQQTTPLIPATHLKLGGRVLQWCAGAAIRTSLVVTPRPAALLVRKVFAVGGAQFATWSVAANLTRTSPPGLIPVGNADPHTHRPPLGHEYQFNLDTSEGQLFLERLLTFLHRLFQD